MEYPSIILLKNMVRSLTAPVKNCCDIDRMNRDHFHADCHRQDGEICIHQHPMLGACNYCTDEGNCTHPDAIHQAVEEERRGANHARE